jgi:MFS family permease
VARDVRLITVARGLRQAAYGMMAVILAIALTGAGLSAITIGLLISVSLAGDLFGTLVIGRWADQWGRRRTLTVLALLMAATGLIFGLAGLFDLTRWYPLLLVAAFFGTLGTSASETAPFLPIEQAILGQVGKGEDRTRRFATYNFVAVFAGALGALMAGLPDLALRYGIPMPVSLEFSFALYAVVALVVALLASRLSSAVEAPTAAQSMPSPVSAITVSRDDPPHMTRWRLFPSLPHSRHVVLQLSGLFSLDAFAGGLVAQTLMALYFHLRFGVSLGLLAILFFAANLLSALSFLAAPALARRFGLLNTMVFTHLPSNLLLILVPLMPTFPLAAALLLLRQAYTMALVTPAERTAAASATSVARSAGAAASPALAGILLQGPLLVFGAPFLIAGGLKALYDLSLWRLFRRVRLPEDREATS